MTFAGITRYFPDFSPPNAVFKIPVKADFKLTILQKINTATIKF